MYGDHDLLNSLYARSRSEHDNSFARHAIPSLYVRSGSELDNSLARHAVPSSKKP